MEHYLSAAPDNDNARICKRLTLARARANHLVVTVLAMAAGFSEPDGSILSDLAGLAAKVELDVQVVA
jgi:hypothetical protein